MARKLTTPTAPRRRLAALLVVLAVLLAHAWVVRRVDASIASWNTAAALPERIAVAFVRELKPEPVALPPAPQPPAPKPPRRKPKAPAAPAVAASQPSAAASEPALAETVAQAAPPVDTAAAPYEAASAAPAVEQTASEPAGQQPPGFAEAVDAAAGDAQHREWPSQWPASTRLHYTLTGWYRGEVHGSASVEWLREGSHYQVHLEVVVGPSLLPLMSRRMSSDGELTEGGLEPRRYDEETKVALREARRATIRFDGDAVILPGGQRRERWPGVQDAASQFVHLTWLFTTDPSRLAPGSIVEVPLALPRSIDRWTYDVLDAEELRLPFGTLPVRHLKPRRLSRPLGGDMTVEVWIAPTLLYLPVRIRIHQDADTFVDLLIDKPPLQAG